MKHDQSYIEAIPAYDMLLDGFIQAQKKEDVAGINTVMESLYAHWNVYQTQIKETIEGATLAIRITLGVASACLPLGAVATYEDITAGAVNPVDILIPTIFATCIIMNRVIAHRLQKTQELQSHFHRYATTKLTSN